MIAGTIESLGTQNILVNNAAYQVSGNTIDDVSTSEFDRIYRINVYAPFWISRAGIDRLPPGGSNINTVSTQGYIPSSFLFPYATTKSALIGMTKSLAKLAIERGIRANAVAPGCLWTPRIPSSMPADKFKIFGSETLFERRAQLIELAPRYVRLASPDAEYVTMEMFRCTSGLSPF